MIPERGLTGPLIPERGLTGPLIPERGLTGPLIPERELTGRYIWMWGWREGLEGGGGWGGFSRCYLMLVAAVLLGQSVAGELRFCCYRAKLLAGLLLADNVNSLRSSCARRRENSRVENGYHGNVYRVPIIHTHKQQQQQNRYKEKNRSRCRRMGANAINKYNAIGRFLRRTRHTHGQQRRPKTRASVGKSVHFVR